MKRLKGKHADDVMDQHESDEQRPYSGSHSCIHQPGNDGLNIATPIDDNTNSEGNIDTSEQVPRFQNLYENQTEDVNPELRRSNRPSKQPAKLNEFVLDNRVKYELNRYANHTFLDAESSCFISNLNKSLKPSSFEEASKDPNWICAMNDEMNALYENDTWTLVDLPYGRKPIESKWVFKIKYKSDREVDRCLLSLDVQKDWDIFQMDVNNAFLYGDLNEEVYTLPPPGFFYPSEKKHMHAPLKSHFDIALRLLKYLKLAPGNVFVNGCLVFMEKQEASYPYLNSSAKLRSMAACKLCEIIWIVKVMKDLNIGNLLPAELHFDNKSAIQIAANPVMHGARELEPPKVRWNVHLVREKVSSGLIKTVKVDSKNMWLIF
ncbi:ribonuclease H-like domain-containing protein [Tanacetum coccineum]